MLAYGPDVESGPGGRSQCTAASRGTLLVVGKDPRMRSRDGPLSW